ncbi:hypothetical protein [Streptomyces sp. WM6378]|uniref:hypothetical protein n=1 Tax=Streptomyces sp. WM6378 TaxID=1415557 RepID=UPI00131D61EA|nr:hypothetical protein [Streptomyces sp. WM6378]
MRGDASTSHHHDHPETYVNAPLPTSLEDLAVEMTRHGWDVSWQRNHGEARVEGSLRGGAAAMATARYTLEKGWVTRFYAIESVEDEGTHWLRIRRNALLTFISTDRLPADARRWIVRHTKCRCRKHSQPTQWRALHLLAGIQLERLSTRGVEEEKRVYRCRYDARRWHLTSQDERTPSSWHGTAAAL